MNFRKSNNQENRSSPRFGARRSSGGRNFKTRSFRAGNSRNFSKAQMYDAVCDKCKKECRIKFKPGSDKPILCDDCFRDKRGLSISSGKSITMEQFNELNLKIDKILELLNHQSQ